MGDGQWGAVRLRQGAQQAAFRQPDLSLRLDVWFESTQQRTGRKKQSGQKLVVGDCAACEAHAAGLPLPGTWPPRHLFKCVWTRRDILRPPGLLKTLTQTPPNGVPRRDSFGPPVVTALEQSQDVRLGTEQSRTPATAGAEDRYRRGTLDSAGLRGKST